MQYSKLELVSFSLLNASSIILNKKYYLIIILN